MVLLARRPTEAKPKKDFVEIVISRSCQGRPLNADRIEHLALGRRLKVTEEEARQLVLWSGAAYYVSPDDDPSNDNFCTLNPQRQAAIDSELRLLKQRDDQRSENEAYSRAQRLALIAQYGTADILRGQ